MECVRGGEAGTRCKKGSSRWGAQGVGRLGLVMGRPGMMAAGVCERQGGWDRLLGGRWQKAV